MDNNIKDIIKIPNKLDDAVLKGFQKGKSEKKKEKRKVILKRSAIAASVIVVTTVMVGAINPELVKAIPLVGDIFEYFNDGVYNQSLDKYEELGENINLTSVDKDVKVTLNKVVVDDNIFIATLLVESNKLSGYDEVRSPQDFLNVDFNIRINGEVPSTYHSNVTIVDDRTAAIVLEVDVSDLKLNEDVKINLDITNMTRGRKKIASGHWDFNIRTTKGYNSKTYEVNERIELSNEELNFEKLVVSDLMSKLFLKGSINNYKDFDINKESFIIRDNNGKILLDEFKGGHISYEGYYEYSFNILNDLTNSEYIEIIKSSGNETIRKEIEGWKYDLLKASSSDEESTNRSNEIISREPTKEELSDGYALDKVRYNIDIDKNTAFESINDLIGKEVVINKTDKIIVKDIISKDDYTEVVMKIDGNYDYWHLSGTVLFDEDMNDSATFEGSMTVLNDIEEKIVTVKLTKIDPSKKYTIAIPITTDLVIDESQKIRINIK